MMPKRWSLYPIIFLLLFFYSDNLFSQRTYSTNSVLSTGTWFRIGVTSQGVYRLDLPFFQSLGLNSQSIPSASLRVFGNDGAMLPENNINSVIDDLRENAIQVVDGGDGILNGTDYVLI